MIRKLIPILTIIVTTSIVVIGCSSNSGEADTNVPVETSKDGMKPTGAGGPADGNNGPSFGKAQPN